MKHKSSKEKRGEDLNESLGTFVEPSFSKITFRNKNHDSSLQDIGEEDDPAENLSTEYPMTSLEMPDIGEKEEGLTNRSPYSTECRKKKKTKFLNSVPQTLNEIPTDRHENDDLGEVFESNRLNCSMTSSESSNGHKKKKKKKNKTKISELSLHQPNVSEGFKSEKGRDSNAEDGPETRLEFYQPPNKKNKAKHNQLSSVEEESEVISIQDCILYPKSEKINSKKKVKVNRFETIPINNFENNKKEKFSGRFTPLFDSSSERHKRKSLQIEENISDIVDSPLFSEKKKKKKAQKLLDESHLDKSSYELLQNDINETNSGLITSSDLAVTKDSSSSLSLAKKRKKKKVIVDESDLSPVNNNLLDNGRSTQNKSYEICNELNISQYNQVAKKCKNKQKLSCEMLNMQNETTSSEFVCIDSKPSKLIPNLPNAEYENLLINESDDQLEKKQNKHNKLQKHEMLRSLQLLPKEKFNKKKKNHLESLVSKLSVVSYNSSLSPGAKEKTHEKEIRGDQPQEDNVEENFISVPALTLNKEDSVMITKPSEIKYDNMTSKTKGKAKSKKDMTLPKKKRKIQNIDILRNQLLKEAYSGTEESEVLPQKSTKSNAGMGKNVKTLITQSVKDGISDTDVSKNVLKESTNEKMEVEKHVDTLRMQLLKEAFSCKVKCEDFPSKSKKTKKLKASDVYEDLEKDSKKKIKKKKKPKVKNDIDRLTDILISKALKKVSSSNESHSSQENINNVNLERKNTSPKECRIENKILEVEENNFNPSTHKTKKVKEHRLHLSEAKKIQKSLLSDAMKIINPVFETSKNNSKKVNSHGSKKSSSVVGADKKKVKKKHKIKEIV